MDLNLDRCPVAEALLAVDRRGTIISANTRAHDLLGYEPNELVGLHCSVLIPEDSRAYHRDLERKYWEDPSPRPMGNGRRLPAVRKNGEVFLTEIAIYPHRNFVVVAMVDVSVERIRDLLDGLKHIVEAINAKPEGGRTA